MKSIQQIAKNPGISTNFKTCLGINFWVIKEAMFREKRAYGSPIFTMF
jgi:hypothetical protein